MKPISRFLSRFILIMGITVLAGGALCFVLPPQADLTVNADKDLPLYSRPFPGEHSLFAPGEITTPDGKLVNWRAVPGALSCGECHPKETLEWATSIHAISDLDLIYDSTVRENTDKAKVATAHGIEKGRWCESCHNPLGVLAGAVTPANSVQNLSAMEEGTACIVCHAVNKAEPMVGNGALEVDINGIFRYGHPALIAAAPSRHARDMRARRGQPLMGSSTLCGACHTEIRPSTVNSTTPPMAFQDTYNEWRHSPWSRKGIQCQDCHMAANPAEFVAALKRGERPEKTVSHRIAGNNYLLSHTGLPSGLLTALRGGSPPGINRLFDRATFTKALGKTHEQVIGLLQEAAELRVEAAPGKPDDNKLRLNVFVTNAGAGHALPTGPLDQRYMWLEIEVQDASGKTLAHLGKFDGEKGTEPPDAVRWMKEAIDMEGKVDLRHMLFDSVSLRYTRKPIASRATDKVSYAIELPKDSQGTLTVKARLWYRLAVQDILKNIESQGLGKVEAIIPPVMLKEASLSHTLAAERVDTVSAVKPSQNDRHCERSEAIQNPVQQTVWIASPCGGVAPLPLGEGLGVRERGKGITPVPIPAPLPHPALRATLS
ncbi:MAG: hypothetical protein LBG78_08555, partial [Azoarcus sp.]|nr:hypothetical protein [Azoarcus sp.]